MSQPDVSKCTFGIEYEFDFINPYGRVRGYGDPYSMRPYIVVTSDATAGAEIYTKPFTEIDELLDVFDRYFNEWLRYSDTIPFMQSGAIHRSMGVHVHLGFADRSVTSHEGISIAVGVRPLIPFLAALSSNPTPSKRLKDSTYCRPLYEQPVGSSHYVEVNFADEGTIETRPYDTNIPQVTATIAYLLHETEKYSIKEILTKHSSMALKYHWEDIAGVTSAWYRVNRDNAYKGVHAVDQMPILRTLHSVVEANRLNEFPSESIRDVLYLSLVEQRTPSTIWRTIYRYMKGKNDDDAYEASYRYYREMITHPREFLSIFLTLDVDISQVMVNKIQKYVVQASRVSDWRTLLKLATRSIVCTPTRGVKWDMIVQSIATYRVDKNLRDVIIQAIGEANYDVLVSAINQLISTDDWRRAEEIIDDVNRRIGIPKKVLWRLIPTLSEMREEYRVEEMLSRIRDRIRSGEQSFFIRRIYEVEGKTSYEVASEILKLLRAYGEGMVNIRFNTPDEIIAANERFYVAVTCVEGNWYVLGVAAVRRATGYISHVVVRPSVRRCGIASILLSECIDVALENGKIPYLHVKNNNTAMMSLVQKFNFVPVEKGETATLFKYQFRPKVTGQTTLASERWAKSWERSTR